MNSIQEERLFDVIYLGPFGYDEGRDGVDDTFDVFCLSRNKQVISTYYWNERERAELVAQVVSVALNRRYPGTWVVHEGDCERFLNQFPGPYYFRSETCEYRGPCELICSEGTEEAVIAAYEASKARAKLIATEITSALNEWRMSFQR